MKGVALNLKQSPEKHEYWECADPLIVGAGHAVRTPWTSECRHPGVEDSIEPYKDRYTTRQGDEQGALGESTAMEVPKYLAQCKKRVRDGRVVSDGDRRTAKV